MPAIQFKTEIAKVTVLRSLATMKMTVTPFRIEMSKVCVSLKYAATKTTATQFKTETHRTSVCLCSEPVTVATTRSGWPDGFPKLCKWNGMIEENGGLNIAANRYSKKWGADGAWSGFGAVYVVLS